ncbi:MAG TPA: 7-carboxy-7-deazaguanine synthase QueE [Myxococcota bacterium]|nr:7-carboxy-7-deazaguanine synthase QueE [Myxococcota bacterium]
MSEPVAGNFVEVFSSVQGEGPHVGEATLFVRLGVCDLRCRWCDSPHTWGPSAACRIESARGSGAFRSAPNPMAVGDVLEAAEALDLDAHAFVSLTGGEPLLQPAVVAALGAALRGRRPRVHLETHGLHAEALERVLGAIDVVSMDWKLASDVRREGEPLAVLAQPGRDFHAAHERFLRVALGAPERYVKIVVTPASGDAEVIEACERIARIAPDTLVVLQPVTPFGPVRERPTAKRMLALAARAERVLAAVRVIPQTHPVYGAP